METFLLYTLGVVGFVVAIMVSIGLHELGHLTVAKKFGTRVTDYFIGFGPTLWSRQKGETEYGLKAIPLGGFIRIVGMVPPDKRHPDKIRESNTGMFTQVVSKAREVDLEYIKPEDEDRLFYKLPWYKKFAVMAAGPAVNIVLAFICFLGVFMTYGDREFDVADGRPELVAVDECLLPWDEYRLTCLPEDPKTPAFAAGLKPGDKVLSFNGTPIEEWSDAQELIRANGGDDFTMGVERDGKQLSLTGTTASQIRPLDDEGENLQEVGFLGVTPRYEEKVIIGGPVYTVKWMGERSLEVIQSFQTLPAKVGNVLQAIVGTEERDPEGPVSIVGGSRFAGETVASQEPEDTPVSKLVFMVTLVGAFNLFIGIFNFLPILPLDGGHMAGSLWEGFRRRLAKLLGRKDPGAFDIAKLMPMAQVVGLMFFILGIILIVGDIVAPITMG